MIFHRLHRLPSLGKNGAVVIGVAPCSRAPCRPVLSFFVVPRHDIPRHRRPQPRRQKLSRGRRRARRGAKKARREPGHRRTQKRPRGTGAEIPCRTGACEKSRNCAPGTLSPSEPAPRGRPRKSLVRLIRLFAKSSPHTTRTPTKKVSAAAMHLLISRPRA